LLGLCLVIGGCRPGEEQAARDPDVAAGQANSDTVTNGGRVWALLVNGGGSPEKNYQSHMLHVRELIELLEVRGVALDRISVVASDGPDPTPDLAVLSASDDAAGWLVDRLQVGRLLAPAVELVDTRIEGVEIAAADRSNLRKRFNALRQVLQAGDDLLVYVTDHGWKNPENLRENGIVLWGDRLLVSEFAELLATLPKGVRTVLVMSQCYSGSFAGVVNHPTIEPGTVCGYFSTTAARPAYGCYAENRGRDNVGHGFWFIEGVRDSRNLEEAHRTVLLNDRTPDVPLRSSDAYASELVRREAAARGVPFEDLVDRFLEQAWADELHYRERFALIDRIGREYGAFGPRSLDDLRERMANLPELTRTLNAFADRWQRSLDDLRRDNFSRFLVAEPHWREYVRPEFVDGLDETERERIRAWLLDDLSRYTDSQPETRRRLELLHSMARESRAGAYRMQVRLGAALRMETLLTSIAGSVYLDRHATGPEREMFEALRECESLELGARTRPLGRRRKPSEAYPPLAQELDLLATVLPGYLGVEYAVPDAATRQRYSLPAGAVRVTAVDPGSPAAAARIVAGDIVLGPPGAHFAERNEIREWTLTALGGERRTLEILRDGEIRPVELRIGGFPG
jgi:hypothetical protein